MVSLSHLFARNLCFTIDVQRGDAIDAEASHVALGCSPALKCNCSCYALRRNIVFCFSFLDRSLEGISPLSPSSLVAAMSQHSPTYPYLRRLVVVRDTGRFYPAGIRRFGKSRRAKPQLEFPER